MESLSFRGRSLVESPPLAPYIAAHFERAALPWDAEQRPGGYIGLCVAENKMMAEPLGAFLGAEFELPRAALGYDAPVGNLEFRQALAAFMAQHITGEEVEIDPSQLVVLAGAGSVLEMLFYAIGDPGDTVLVPTPSYAGFWADLETRDELKVQPVDTSSAEGFALSIEALEAAYANASSPVRALLFCSPDNPMGRVYTRAQLEAVLAWAQAKQIHVVFDEVYALSVFGEEPFVSAASLCPGPRGLGDHVHIVWGFSKDFGASGLRCGVLLSHNAQLLRAVGSLSYWAMVSGPTQHRLRALLEDGPRVRAHIAKMRAGLGSAYANLSRGLGQLGVPHVAAQAGFFVVCDLRAHLPSSDWAGERELWARILAESNINMTPGEACRICEPGFFRLCYAAVPPAAIAEALRRLGRVLGQPRA